MKINKELCTGCRLCVDYCPVDAITMVDGKARIDLDECVECGNCLRRAKCPKKAIYQQELKWPRAVRSMLSDPLTITEEAGIAGRGTEEMKTNDVTGRFRHGQVGVAIELGRPCLGTLFRDVERVAMAVATLNVEFEPCNPLTSLMSNKETGKFIDELLGEKVLSVIIEFTIPLKKIAGLMNVLKDVAGRIDTVFSLSFASRVNEDGSLATTAILDDLGVWHAPNGKANVGLGRPLFKEE